MRESKVSMRESKASSRMKGALARKQSDEALVSKGSRVGFSSGIS